MSKNRIVVRHATEHNLKNIDVDIPHHRLTVITGVSGSGKSSLAFDTICKEGQRRYLESFSAYARQYLGKLNRPHVGHIDGLSPAIAVDQKTVVRNPRSTVGTMTELYDHLRLLFARLGHVPGDYDGPPLERRLFSFNSPTGACPQCKGLGVQDRIDVDLIVADPSKTLRQGAMVITTPSGYIIYSQVTMEVLDKVCRSHGFNVDIPWRELTPEQQHMVLYGSDRIKIPYGKHPLESRLKWSGITAKPREEGFYKGILPVMENILRVDRNKNILRFARTVPCESCGGTRLNPHALAVTFMGKNIHQYAAMSIDNLHESFKHMTYPPTQVAVGDSIREVVLERTHWLQTLGLGYLTLERESTTLSGGEAQRIRLAVQVGTRLRGILYVLDEPSIGLHHRDNRRLLETLHKLRDNGNTVLVVEHDEDTVRSADHLIDIGPGAGVNGGEILFHGPVHELLENDSYKNSATRDYLTGRDIVPVPQKRREGNGKWLTVSGASRYNLKNIDVSFKLGALNVVTGVSGAGKSTLVREVSEGRENGRVRGMELIDKIIEIDQSPIGRTPRSNPATYTKLFDHVRNLFADLPQSKEKGYAKGRFSFNNTGGRCETCQGAGLQQMGMHFLGSVDVVCEECGGKRFNDETLEIRYNNKNIYDILEMPIREAVDFFNDYPKIRRFLQTMNELGLGYLSLGQSSTTLSGGEAQRVKLASELGKSATGKTLYILDEPTTGLHAADIKVLLHSLERLVEKGNTIIMVEHHPDILKSADWLVDLGPESGEKGGELVAMGTPEEVARCTRSHTGVFLRDVLTGESTYKPIGDKARRDVADDPICLTGVSTHNLKNIDVTIPVNRFTVITGVSGSGKSSLAFDTIFAEGQQRFMSGFSTYARTLLAGSLRGEVESVSGLMPTIAVSQQTAARSPRSTVGTMTEIYDYYRLLYSRAGQPQTKPLLSTMFSFNHHQGACNHCKGLGAVTVCDPRKLVTHPERSLMDGAMDGSKSGKFHGDPHGQYIAILQAVGEARGIDYSVSWEQLDETARDIAMYGTGEVKYNVNWKYKRKNRVGEHRFETAWEGFVNYINQEYERKHADHRGHAMLSIMTDQTCPRCLGHRLKPEILSIKYHGLSIAELSQKPVNESIEFFNQIVPGEQAFSDLLRQIIRRLEFLRDLGLGYLTLDRSAATLSGGEAQRIRLAGQLGSGLTGVTYILDEPTIGLHSRDTGRLIAILKSLRDAGNTVIVVEHDAEVIRAADHIIDLGPGSGVMGGEIVAQGTLAQVMQNKESKTAKYIDNPDVFTPVGESRNLLPGIQINGAYANNLKNIDVDIPCGGLILLTGVSGSGKSTLIFDVLAASVRRGEAVGCHAINGFNHFQSIIAIDQKSIGSSPHSTPATYTGLFDHIRQLFTRDPLSIERGYKKSRFSFNVKGGRCETCQGMGSVRTSMDFLADVWSLCGDCKGKRYNAETLEITYNGKTITGVLEMTVSQARAFFRENHEPAVGDVLENILEKMESVGLGYVQLGQPGNTLSGGESQRLKLVTRLIKDQKSSQKGTGREKGREQNLYLFDEPTTGLHFEDVERLLNLFHRLARAGHTLLIIEHHPDVIRNADYIINLGPEGGDRGGEITSAGPAQQFQVPRSNSRSRAAGLKVC